MKVAVPLAKKCLAPSATMVSASALDAAIQIKMCEGVVKAGKGITLVV